eukprot:Hpha_TRINITY_DN11710_c0_g1::TRINITY_DN11710_c0_g1_i1::g.31755::m.31755
MSGHLMVEIVKCENLLKKDWFASDPYVVVTFSSGSNQTESQTEYKSNTLNPVYARRFQFKATEQCDKLTFTIYDHDLMGAHEYMGEASIWVGSANRSAELSFVEQAEDEGEETEETPEKAYERKRLQKLERAAQPGMYEHSPAGVDHEGLTIKVLDKDNDWQDAGTITIRWVYSYSSFGGLFAAKLDDIQMAERTKAEALPEFDLDVLKGNIDKIDKHINNLFAPIAYLKDVLNWQNPSESVMWFVVIVYLLRVGLTLSFIPFALALMMVKNWYTWWRWGPAGPPILKWELPVDPDGGNKNEGDTISNDGDDDAFILTKLKRMGAKAQKITDGIVKELDMVNDVLMWKRPAESMLVTVSLLGVSVLLALPFLFTLIGMIIAPIWPYLANVVILYMFTLFPLYNQFPYLKKYYQIDDLIELLIFQIVHMINWIPARFTYKSALSAATRHLHKNISPELLELLDALDSVHVKPNGAANDILQVLRTRIFHPEARKAATLARREKDRIPPVQVYEQFIVFNAFRRQQGMPCEFFVEKECDPEAEIPQFKLRKAIEKTQVELFSVAVATAVSDAIKADLTFRSEPKGDERTMMMDKLLGTPMWIPLPKIHALKQARLKLIELGIDQGKEVQKRERNRKYGDKVPKKPRLTVNILNCRGLVSREKGKRVDSRVTYVKVVLGQHSVVTDKKKHSTAPQFRSQCKFGFDKDGSDAFDPRACPFLRIELHEEGRKGAFGQVEVDIRNLPRRTETKERYYNLRRRGNEVVGQISMSFFAEAFGVESIKFDKDVASSLGEDRVLQRMYWQAVRGDSRSNDGLSLGRTASLPKECLQAVAGEHISVEDLHRLNPSTKTESASEDGPKSKQEMTEGDKIWMGVSLASRTGNESMLGGGPCSPERSRLGNSVVSDGGVNGDQLRDEISMLRRMIEDTKALVEEDDKRIREITEPTPPGPATGGMDKLSPTPVSGQKHGDGDDETVGSDVSEEIVPPQLPTLEVVPPPVEKSRDIAAGAAAPAAPPPPAQDAGSRRASAVEVADRRPSQAEVSAPQTAESRRGSAVAPAAVPRALSVSREVTLPLSAQPQTAAPVPEAAPAPVVSAAPQTAVKAAPAPAAPAPAPAAPVQSVELPPRQSPTPDSSAANMHSVAPSSPQHDEQHVSRDVFREVDRVVRQGVGAGALTGGATPPASGVSVSSPSRGGPRFAPSVPAPGRQSPAAQQRSGSQNAGREASDFKANFYCDGCSIPDSLQPITVARWSAMDNPDYDLCEDCFTHNSARQLLDPSRFRRIRLTRDEEPETQLRLTPEIRQARARLCEARLTNDRESERTWSSALRQMCLVGLEPPPDVLGSPGMSAAEKYAVKRRHSGFPDSTDPFERGSRRSSRVGWASTSKDFASPTGGATSSLLGR